MRRRRKSDKNRQKRISPLKVQEEIQETSVIAAGGIHISRRMPSYYELEKDDNKQKVTGTLDLINRCYPKE